MRKAKSKKRSICGAGTCFVFFSFSADNQWQMRYIVEVATANARRVSSLRDPQALRPPKRAGPFLDSGRSTKTARHQDTTVRRDTDVGTEEVGDEEIVDEFDKDPALL
jgi:carbamate kinase